MAIHSQMQKELSNTHQANMETICEICGDIGFHEAIITCCECKNVVVHQYCVLGYYKDEPVDWCCEECDIGNGVLFSSSGLENEHFEGSTLKAFGKICQSNVQPKKHSKFTDLYFLTTDVAYILGPGGSTIQGHSSPDVVNESRRMKLSRSHLYDPGIIASWKGSFYILGALELAPGIFNNCIQAHPPSRVRYNVYNFSQLLPDTLKFELVSHGEIWESIFNNHCPSKEDIGLYFFASGSERSDKYIALVEFMRTKDLVMRTVVYDVELLIFVSTDLCSDSQSGFELLMDGAAQKILGNIKKHHTAVSFFITDFYLQAISGGILHSL